MARTVPMAKPIMNCVAAVTDVNPKIGINKIK